MIASRIAARSVRVAALRAPIATAARTYATPASSASTTPASSASTKPPVALFGLDGTYASALVSPFAAREITGQALAVGHGQPKSANPMFAQYTAAAKTSTLDSVGKAMESLHQSFKRDPKLHTILTAPSLTASDKKQVIAELQKSTGVQDKGDTVKNFLNTLADNNRLNVLDGVCEKFGMLMGASRGEVELTVTSAAPLDGKVLKQLETAISKSQYVGQGKKLKVVPKVPCVIYTPCMPDHRLPPEQVNPDIRGGLIVEIGDRTIDLSVSARMARMNKLLKDTL
ncbi:ATP synthase F0 subcomplex subunit OSCP atp5 [Elasticomyces elasticus]|nr:ATP synthase F0 subcomplex subunit OSCP atp5 [Elasticomyces elasticus]